MADSELTVIHCSDDEPEQLKRVCREIPIEEDASAMHVGEDIGTKSTKKAADMDWEDDDEGFGEGDDGGWGNMKEGDDEVDEREVEPVPKSRGIAVGVISAKEIKERREKLISAASEELNISMTEASCLLRFFRWQEAKLRAQWYQEPEKVRIRAGVSVRHGSPLNVEVGDKTVCCVCSKKPRYVLPCKHGWCSLCMERSCVAAISAGQTKTLFAVCGATTTGQSSCNEMIPDEVFEHILSLVDKQQFSWSCSKCTFANTENQTLKCSVCDTAKSTPPGFVGSLSRLLSGNRPSPSTPLMVQGEGRYVGIGPGARQTPAFEQKGFFSGVTNLFSGKKPSQPHAKLGFTHVDVSSPIVEEKITQIPVSYLAYYRQTHDKSFVFSHPHFSWCPNDCGRAGYYEEGGVVPVDCTCGRIFCFYCGAMPHPPLPCDLVRNFSARKNVADSVVLCDDVMPVSGVMPKQTRFMTKKCPSCNFPNKLTLGSSYSVNCSHCHTNFCWMCLRLMAHHPETIGTGECMANSSGVFHAHELESIVKAFEAVSNSCLERQQHLLQFEELRKNKTGHEFLDNLVAEACHSARLAQYLTLLSYYLTGPFKSLLAESVQTQTEKLNELYALFKNPLVEIDQLPFHVSDSSLSSSSSSSSAASSSSSFSSSASSSSPPASVDVPMEHVSEKLYPKFVPTTDDKRYVVEHADQLLQNINKSKLIQLRGALSAQALSLESRTSPECREFNLNFALPPWEDSVLGLSPEQKLAFLLGLRPNPSLMTQNGMYRSFAQNYLYDQNLLPLIFSYTAAAAPPDEKIQLGLSTSASVSGWEVLSIRQLKLYAMHFVSAIERDNGLVAIEDFTFSTPISVSEGPLCLTGGQQLYCSTGWHTAHKMADFVQLCIANNPAAPLKGNSNLLSMVHDSRVYPHPSGIHAVKIFFRKNGEPVKPFVPPVLLPLFGPSEPTEAKQAPEDSSDSEDEPFKK